MVLSRAFTSMLVGTVDVLRFCSGFHARHVEADEFDWSYIEREGEDPSTAETVVFLHGFGARKESWLRIAMKLDKKYRILAPDLPGQGRTTPVDPSRSYSIDDQARRLHKFLAEIVASDQKVHVVGCSMGGMLAGMFAALFPERVNSLTVMCPAGITMPNKSDIYRTLEETGKNLLLAHTTDDLLEVTKIMSHTPSAIPRWVAHCLAAQRRRELPVLEKIVGDAMKKPTILEEHLHLITAKTLVMWGKNDRILDVSSLPILEAKMANVPLKHVLLVDDCGHVIQHEKHAACSVAINAFLQDQVPVMV